ncbi:MAG: AAA family ATPase, partial [Bacteroidota bacterium]
MKFFLLFGPSAVGKMTVAKALAERTGFKMMHNHVSLELANRFFDFGTDPFRRLDRLVRWGVFREVAKSDLPGFIFTFVWAQGEPREDAYVDEIVAVFQEQGASIHYVELAADQSVRLQRNRHPDRLQEKPSKRDIERSEQVFMHDEDNYRLNTLPGEHPERNILKIDNTHLSPEAVAERIV